MNASGSGCCGGCSNTPPKRRSFLGMALAVLFGAAAYLPPAVAGLLSFLSPLRQKGQKAQSFRLASLESLSDDVPFRAPVIADRSDAWTRFPQEPIGAVYLVRHGAQVEAFQVVCPHAGCFVTYDAENKKFFCPCHVASFDLGGKRMDATSPSPRDLDTLVAEVRDGGQVWVEFQNFQVGISQKVPQA